MQRKRASEVGQVLRELREADELEGKAGATTQTKLGHRATVDVGVISRLERGWKNMDPRLSTVVALAYALGKPVRIGDYEIVPDEAEDAAATVADNGRA